MFAKWFDSIRLSSLFAALLVAAAVAGVLVGLARLPLPQFHIAEYQWVATDLAFQITAIFSIVLSAWMLAGGLNAADFLTKKNYQAIPIFTFLFTPFALVSASLNLVLALPLLVLIFIKLPCIHDPSRLPFVLFDVGTLIGVSSILIPQTIIFLLISWFAIFSFGTIYFRAFLMPLVGIFAVWFLTASLLIFSGISVAEFYLSIFSKIEFGILFSIAENESWKWIPLAALSLLSLLFALGGFARTSVLERRTFTYATLSFLILLSIGIFSSGASNVWAWLCLPLTIFLLKSLENLKKHWQRDLVYLFLMIHVAVFLV